MRSLRVINRKSGDAIADVARLILDEDDETPEPSGDGAVDATPAEPEASESA